MKAVLCTAAVFTALGAGSQAVAADEQTWKGDTRDAWIDGRIEASYAVSPYLNPFSIDTRVERGRVTLTGHVESQIDKDLAEEIAEGVDGVESVKNELEIRPNSRDQRKRTDGDRDFGTVVSDATTTARVKTALLANASTAGLSIDVDTERGIVSLGGTVESREERELAGRVADNTEGVKKVKNRLEVAKK